MKALFAAAALAAVPGAAFAASPSPAQPPPQPCTIPRVTGRVLCGTFDVFEDRRRGSGRTIALNVVVLQAAHLPAEADPFVVLVGGPGESAVAEAPDTSFAAIRETRDVVLVDQRGTGGSNGLRCGARGEDLAAVFFAGTAPRDAIRACRERLSPAADLRAYTTSAAADDLDDVRAWLRYDRLNLYGSSYGTRVALVYLRQHPDRVRTATLRGVLSTSADKPLGESRDAQRSLNLAFAACANEPSCAAAFPQPKTELAAVLERLASAPAAVDVIDRRTGRTVSIEVTRAMFAGVVRRLLYDTDLQSLVPALIHAAYERDYTPLRRFFGQSFGIESFVSVGMYLTVSCTEDVPFIRDDRIAPETAATFLGRTKVDAMREGCREWPRGALPANYRDPVRAGAPVLIFSGEIDPDTPPSDGEAVARALPNATHVVLPAIAHSPFPPCAIGIMSGFIAAGRMDGVATDCVRTLRRPPFLTAMPASASAR